MPEAVASNSTPAPEGQPKFSIPLTADGSPLFTSAFHILTALEDGIENLKALTWMITETLQRDGDLRPVSTGIGNLLRREMEDFEFIHQAVRAEFREADARRKLIDEAMVAADLTSVAAREKIERAVDRLTGTGG